MQSFYNSLGAMSNFSRGLDNVSNNISNMATPGYKGKEMFIRSLEGGASGYGARIDNATVRTAEGDLRQTDSETDLAIIGNGFFVLRNDQGEYFYTRVGQFQFDELGQLVDLATGYNVMAIDDLGVLREVNISENRLLPPEATSEVRLVGNLESGLSTTHTVSDISIYDETGASHRLNIEFTLAPDPAINTWDVVINDETGNQLSVFQIEFGVDSTPLASSSSITQIITLGGQEHTIEFIVGEPGSFAGATQFISGTTNLTAIAQDGHEALGLQALKINEDGQIEFKYANGEEVIGQQVALAYFNDPTMLQASSGGLLSSRLGLEPSIGKPNQEIYGKIQSKRIEMSNVDLTQEFADILIIQRGFQASSRVMSVSNELIEQLYSNTRSG